MPTIDEVVVHVPSACEEEDLFGEHFGGHFADVTPALRTAGNGLGVNLSRVPKGRAVCPFHSHAIEDEVFYILSGSGVLRYGHEVRAIGPGDCISCPAGVGIAHQIANTGEDDLVYLSIGRNDPNEVCVYPDSGKVMVRSLKTVGRLAKTDYHAGEPQPPAVFSMAPKA